MISAAALYVAHAGSSRRCEETILVHGGGVVSGRVLRSPIRMKNRHTLDGLAVPSRYFQSFLDQFGSHVFRHGVANNSFRVAVHHGRQVHESFPGEKHMGDGRPPVSGTGASAVKFLSIRSGRPARSAAGTVVRALGRGWHPLQALLPHEPAHRLWTGCNTTHVPRFCGPVYNRWVCLESLKKYVTKMASSSRRFAGF